MVGLDIIHYGNHVFFQMLKDIELIALDFVYLSMPNGDKKDKQFVI